jgi:2-keto-3-deoxy-6-phosphogluconate aldolase
VEHLKAVYRCVHEQGFLPIFTQSDFNSEALVEACVEAGCRAVEYTLRRHDAHTMIPWIRKRYPELGVLVGSTLDSERFIRHSRPRHPQLLTIDELAAIGVDGFVSMVGFRPETLERYSSTHLMVAPVSTIYEMFSSLNAGAHFVKVFGTQLDLVSTFRGDATYDFCPIMVTGGMTLERLPVAVKNGAVLIGAGFELILSGLEPNASVKQIAKRLEQYLDATRRARDEKWPILANARDSNFSTWTAALPHYHPFNSHPL